jgi:hypothetical protein
MADMYIVPGLNCCWTRRLPNKVNAVIADIMNATAEQLDNFLREADPATAQTVEQIVRGLLSLRPKAVAPPLLRRLRQPPTGCPRAISEPGLASTLQS